MNHEIESRVTSFLGLCLRAGRLTTGQEACVELIRRGGAALALVDGARLPTRSSVCRTHAAAMIRRSMHCRPARWGIASESLPA